MTAPQQMIALPTLAAELGIPPYRLRSWENLYPVFHSQRENDGQRYYQTEDIAVIRRIFDLLYKENQKSHEIMNFLKEEGLSVSEETLLPEKNIREQRETQHELVLLLENLKEENAQLKRKAESEREIKNNLDVKLHSLQTELSKTVTVLGEENARLQEQVNESNHLKKTFHAIEKQHTALQKELKEKQETFGQYQELRRYLDDVEKENLRLQEALEQSAEKNSIDTEALREEIEKFKKFHNQDEETFSQLAEIEEEKVRLQQKVSMFEKKYDESQQELNALERKCLRYEEQLSHAHSTIDKMSVSIEDQKTVGEPGQYNALKSRLEKTEQEKRQFLEKLEEAASALQILENDKKRLQSQLSSLESKDREIKNLQARLKLSAASKDEVESLQNGVRRAVKDVQEMKKFLLS